MMESRWRGFVCDSRATLLSKSNNQPFEELCGWIKALPNPSAKCDISMHSNTNNIRKTTHKNNIGSNISAAIDEMVAKCLCECVRVYSVCLSLFSSSLVTFNPLCFLVENKAPILWFFIFHSFSVSDIVLTLGRRQLQALARHHQSIHSQCEYHALPQLLAQKSFLCG